MKVSVSHSWTGLGRRLIGSLIPRPPIEPVFEILQDCLGDTRGDRYQYYVTSSIYRFILHVLMSSEQFAAVIYRPSVLHTLRCAR